MTRLSDPPGASAPDARRGGRLASYTTGPFTGTTSHGFFPDPSTEIRPGVVEKKKRRNLPFAETTALGRGSHVHNENQIIAFRQQVQEQPRRRVLQAIEVAPEERVFALIRFRRQLSCGV